MKKKIFAILGLMTGLTVVSNAQEQSVKVWEDTLELPTYLLAEPETAPIFDCDWSYQRARRAVYPYALNDNMTREKKNVTYKALYLENEYVKLCVLPEIGGRLFYAVDKTNGYDIFYHQDVIKPANVGMSGAWISGGVEWNFFHHHRVTSHTPSDYKLVENADGSKTIWLGETELRHRMQWAIGITLHPHKSYMEITGRMMNTTPDNNSMLYWSNVSTSVDENYQIIFPQSTEFGVSHCKEYFCHWPVTAEAYTGVEEYKNGIQASWWKAHPCGNSIFAHDLKDDFIAGYDHGRHAGTMLVGNHHIVKGGKFWSWGPNSGWDTNILTDNAGHYIELMQGAYSDNQPDYNWTYPYEVKSFSQYWYGIREMGGVKKGSKQLALNLDSLGKGKVLLGVNATEKLSGLTVKVSKGGDVLFSENIDAAPDTPFVKTIVIDKNIAETELTMTVTDAAGKEMLSYTPALIDPSKPLPPTVRPPKLPHQIENTEECYLVGLRNLQFHNPFIKPTDYFEEVLRRDDGDTRANTQMGVYWRLHGDNEKAAKYLRKAVARQTKDYTRPKDCEAMYNLGLILKAEGKTEAAMDTLYRAVWNYAYNSAANFQLAQIYMGLGDKDMALDRLNEAITYNGNNIAALNLKASILRISGDKNGARELIDRVSAFDPVNTYAAYERKLLDGNDEVTTLMRDNVEAYIELALTYLHNGFTDTAVDLLRYIDTKEAYPVTKMWLGYLADKAGDGSAAKKYYDAALALPTEYCHPFRLETVAVLEKIRDYAPQNYKIYYYLGNIFYDKQPERAVAEWKKCVEINPEFAMAWRNLGWANWKYTKNYAEAAEYYRKAVALDRSQAIFLEELDQVYEAKGEDVRVRYELLKSTHDVNVKRYYPLAAEVITGTFVGDYDYVVDLLRKCYFPTREGVANFHDVYVNALLLAGESKLGEGRTAEAVALYEEAFEYPSNHQVFYVDTRVPRDAQIYYMIADAYEKAGNKSKAALNYRKAAAVNVKKTDYRYWQALALRKLGKTAEADALFDALVEAGRDAVVESFVNFYGAEGTTGETVESINTKAYYTQGLGYLGRGDKAEAKRCFAKSVELKPDNLWSVRMLEKLK
ncbi:MAG: DUF5107 domain-containing protein [Alistipes sp.]|nr:DUF5107 domain-containing protein [Alistipes sp.]